ncbi:hypothetical protein [Brevundimonas sp. PAMC22021]|uniref:hypothetical protein n=1 Tax=Brevundimonas sp. PAMC22021 TaxID=2861285 RepID=UPI001C6288FE|nr:hypothetical protein [Brevundimonas sp. PAMC22021]QYF87022.1 hypothetical protein KY493_00380 [Brevundimonas sp. PAMC22021]
MEPLDIRRRMTQRPDAAKGQTRPPRLTKGLKLWHREPLRSCIGRRVLDFFKRLRRATAAIPPSPTYSPGPPPAQLDKALDGSNPLHQLLNQLGLPWKETRQQVEARVIASLDPFYRRNALFFPDAVRPSGFLQPWTASLFERYAPDAPIVRFSGLAWYTDDAGANIDRIADYFAARLGPAPVGKQYNTLYGRWQAGTASLELQSWPHAWQSPNLQNDAHAREPKLITACRVSLLTGFRLPLSVEEERWVADARPIAETRPFLSPNPGGLANTAPGETEVEYARDPAGYLPQVRNRISCPPGREALILCSHQLFVLPARDVLGFEVLRLLPAKGGGGSSLSVRVRTPCRGVPYKTLRVSDHSDPDGVTGLGQDLAILFGTACDIGPYFDDV